MSYQEPPGVRTSASASEIYESLVCLRAYVENNWEWVLETADELGFDYQNFLPVPPKMPVALGDFEKMPVFMLYQILMSLKGFRAVSDALWAEYGNGDGSDWDMEFCRVYRIQAFDLARRIFFSSFQGIETLEARIEKSLRQQLVAVSQFLTLPIVGKDSDNGQFSKAFAKFFGDVLLIVDEAIEGEEPGKGFDSKNDNGDEDPPMIKGNDEEW
jgi:hypothetical protein